MKISRALLPSVLLLMIVAGGIWQASSPKASRSGLPAVDRTAPHHDLNAGRCKRPAAHPGMDPTLLPTATPPRDDVMTLFDAWAERYLRATGEDKAALREKGGLLAQERRAVLKKLIRVDPAAALLAAVSPELRAPLPNEVAVLA